MPIKAVCQGCKTTYRVPESAAGKSVRCKKCGKSFKVHVPEPADDDELLDALIEEDAGQSDADDADEFDSALPPKSTRRPAPRGRPPAALAGGNAARRAASTGC